jgi:hypothetical protein
MELEPYAQIDDRIAAGNAAVLTADRNMDCVAMKEKR